MRKFHLEDEFGQRVSLMTRAGFLHEPSGLGYGDSIACRSSENGFFEVESKEYEQPNISASIVFLESPYESYKIISDWVASRSQMKLAYSPCDEYYYMDVMVTTLDKTEICQDGYLSCGISFRGLSPWYSRYPLVLTFTEAPENNFKRYSFRYGYCYAVSGTPGSIDFHISGHFKGGVSLFAQGPLAAPVLTLENTQTGEAYGKLDLSAITIEADEQLIYSSQVRGAGVWRQKDGIKTDLIDQVELYAGIPIFMRAPTGTPLTATLDVENVISTTSTLYIDEYWKTR